MDFNDIGYPFKADEDCVSKVDTLQLPPGFIVNYDDFSIQNKPTPHVKPNVMNATETVPDVSLPEPVPNVSPPGTIEQEIQNNPPVVQESQPDENVSDNTVILVLFFILLFIFFTRK